jgi:hypothetical protein
LRRFNELRWHTTCINQHRRHVGQGEWILKIEKDSHGGKTTIRLIGHYWIRHLPRTIAMDHLGLDSEEIDQIPPGKEIVL